MVLRFLVLLVLLAHGPTIAEAQERQWNFDLTDQEAFLVFGVPQTDDVGVSFWCSRQSGIIKLFVPDADPNTAIAASVPFKVKVSDKLFRMKGQTSVNQEAASVSIETELKSSDPLFAELGKARRFSISVGKSSYTYPLYGADFSILLGACQKAM